MKHLLISDVHNNVEYVDKIIEKESGNFNSIIYHCDVFDSYGDDERIAKRTAEWLFKKLIENGDTNRDIFLFSNHDNAFLFPSNQQFKECPGYTEKKGKVVRAVLSKLPRPAYTYFKLFHDIKISGDKHVLFSHAGIDKRNLFGSQDISLNIEECLEFLKLEESKWLEASLNNSYHFFSDRGPSMGESNVGGPLWFRPQGIHGWKPIDCFDVQICGHSCAEKVRRLRSGKNNANTLFILDAYGYYGILDVQENSSQLIAKSLNKNQKEVSWSL